MTSEAMEDYLKTIYRLRDGAEDPVGTGELAEFLEVTPPTVTSMVETLAERGLVEREKYQGVTLTAEGERVALEVVRHHRLLELFLTEHLDYDWSNVHEEADRLEHHISERFEERIAAALDDPTVDPHGDPIPGRDLSPPDQEATPLSSRRPGDRLEVTRVRDCDGPQLEYLADAGVEPGRELLLRDVTPVGTYVVADAGADADDPDGSGGDRSVRHLPEDVAESIHVRPVDGADARDHHAGGDGDREGDVLEDAEVTRP